MTAMTDERRLALREAVEFVNAGRMAVTVGIDTVVQAAEKFHGFLTAGSETPSGTSSAPASTPPASKKTTAPAQPDPESVTF